MIEFQWSVSVWTILNTVLTLSIFGISGLYIGRNCKKFGASIDKLTKAFEAKNAPAKRRA